MVLTRADDFPIHQTAEPIAYSGTDRNFYDRYFFNGYSAQAGDPSLFALGFGVYPHLNIADAAFSVMTEDGQTSIHASRWLGMERLDLEVGPIRLEVLEPLRRLKIRVEAPDKGIRAEIVFEARSAPIEEPRFVRRQGPRTFMDYTRLTQNGRYEGFLEVDGRSSRLEGWIGTRDRSWGVRPVGARDPQEPAPAEPPQFFWLWSPTNLEDESFFFHVNDDAEGRAWNTRAVIAADGSAQGAALNFEHPKAAIEWRPGSRRARRAEIALDDREPDGASALFSPLKEFLMLGAGYGHPRFAHGLNRGALSVEREDVRSAEVDWTLPQHLHVQALCEVELRRPGRPPARGRGVLEQLAFGPHKPSGLKGFADPAP